MKDLSPSWHEVVVVVVAVTTVLFHPASLLPYEEAGFIVILRASKRYTYNALRSYHTKDTNAHTHVVRIILYTCRGLRRVEGDRCSA